METSEGAPAIKGVSHVSLSVSDLEQSLAFYRDVLGLAVLVEPFDGLVFEGREAMLLAGRIVLNLQAHAANDGSHFDPRRTGLDHLAFHVSDQVALTAFADRLNERGVEHSEVKRVPGYGWMIELCDPDGIQIELFTTR